METDQITKLVCMKKKPIVKYDAPAESSVVREEPPVPMQEIGAFEAKTHLSAILEKVAHGETFIITKHGQPIAEIKPVSPPKKKRIMGLWRDRMWVAPDFDAPLEDFKEYME